MHAPVRSEYSPYRYSGGRMLPFHGHHYTQVLGIEAYLTAQPR